MKKKIYLCLLFLIGVLLLPIGVNAAVTVEDTTVEYKWDKANIDIYFPKLPTITEENTQYKFYFTNTKEDIPDITTNPKADLEAYPGWRILSSDNSVNIYDSYNILMGYEHVYVAKCNLTTCDEKLYYAKINKTGIPELTQRYQLYFLNGSFKVFNNFAIGTEEIKVNTKIGIVNDSTVLQSLAKKEKTANEKLLNYAKKASNGTNFSTILGDIENNNILGNYSVKEGTYYYAYTTLDTKDGKYRQVEDVTLLMGKNDTDGKALLSNDVTFQLSDTNITVKPISTTVKNPKTADTNVLISVGILIIVISGFIISYRKFKKVK